MSIIKTCPKCGGTDVTREFNIGYGKGIAIGVFVLVFLPVALILAYVWRKHVCRKCNIYVDDIAYISQKVEHKNIGRAGKSSGTNQIETTKTGWGRGKKIIVAIIGVFFLLFIVVPIIVWLSAPTGKLVNSNVATQQSMTTTTTTTQIPRLWHAVRTFSGISSETTDTFKISGNEWRYTWDCTEQTSVGGYQIGSGFGVMGIFAYPAGNTVSYVSSVTGGKCGISQTSYVYVGNEDYYFSILAGNIQLWDITVEAYY